MNLKKSQNIIYFDGECGLCDFFVQYIYTRDKDKTFLFAPLQGKTATRNLPKKYREELRTVVLETHGHASLRTKSTAALKILSQLPYHGWLKIFLWVPRPIRDFGYDIISKTRKKFFSSKKCFWKSMKDKRILD